MESNTRPVTKVVSARYAALCVEQTKVEFLEKENARLRAELEAERARNRHLFDGIHVDLRKSHQDHLHSLHQQNQQLAASTALVLDALMQHYGQRFLPPHLPHRLRQDQVAELAKQTCLKQPCTSEQDWHRRLQWVDEDQEKRRQLLIRNAIASDLNQKIKQPDQGSKHLEELNKAIADCERALQQPEDDTKKEAMREMVQQLRTEREILVQGLGSALVPVRR